MSKKICFVILACLFGCSGVQGGSAKIIPVWTAADGRGENPLAAPLLYKKTATIGRGWDEIENLAVNYRGDLFATTGSWQIKEVIPPFTGPTHGKMKTLVKCCKYYPDAVAADEAGDEFFLSLGGGSHPHGGLYRVGKNAGIELLCRGQSCGTDSSFAVDANGNIFTFLFVSNCSGQGKTCTNVYKMTKQGDTWLKPVQYGPQLPFAVSLIAVDAAKNIYLSASCYQCPGYPIYRMDGSYNVSRVGKWFSGTPVIAVGRGCKKSCDVYVSLTNRIVEISPPFTGKTNGKINTIYYGSGIGNIAVQGRNIYAIVDGAKSLVELSP
jgi:hypothetical protein